MNEKRTGDTFWKVLSVVLLCTLVALTGIILWQGKEQRPAFFEGTHKTPVQNASLNAGSALKATGDIYWVADLADQALPTVVNIQTLMSAKSREKSAQSGGGSQPDPWEGLPEPFRQMMPQDQQHQQFQLPPGYDGKDFPLGEGSGFIIRDDGYIVTNEHVVAGADKFTVTFNDGSTAEARLIGVDSLKDIAVIKVDKSGLPFVRLGDSAATRIGEPVVAIGSPIGYKATVTAGILSTNDRKMEDLEDRKDVRKTQKYLQTDAAINQGNSGGPLFNSRGEVIGINRAIARWDQSNPMVPVEGVGFAIPVNEVKDAIQQIVEHGKIVYPGISASIASLSDYREDYKMQSGGEELKLVVKDGVFVHSTKVGGPADKAGIKAGDVILALGDEPLTSADEFIGKITKMKVGDRVTLRVARQGGAEQENIMVTLEELDFSGEQQ